MSRRTYEGNEGGGDGCDACPLVPRREFLRDAGAIAAGICGTRRLSGASRRRAAERDQVHRAVRVKRRRIRFLRKMERRSTRTTTSMITRWQGKVLRVRARLSAPEHGAALVRQGRAVRVPQAPLALHAGRPLHQGQRPRHARAGSLRRAQRTGTTSSSISTSCTRKTRTKRQWKTAFVTV